MLSRKGVLIATLAAFLAGFCAGWMVLNNREPAHPTAARRE